MSNIRTKLFSPFSNPQKTMLLLNTIHHPNLLSYKVSFVQDHFLWKVSDFIEAGSVLGVLRSKYPGGIKDPVLLSSILR